jgi:hypothetical protein
LRPALLCCAAHEPGVDAVDGRLVHRGEEAIELVFLFARREHDAGVVDVQMAGDQARGRTFVVRRALQVVERQGERAQAGGRGFAGEADQGGRIQPCGQERTDRNVGEQVGAHALEQAFAHEGGLPAGRDGRRGLHRALQGGGQAPVAYRRAGAGRCVHQQGRACRQQADAAVERERFRNRAPQQESDRPRGFGARVDAFAGQQGGDLGGEAQGPAVVRVIQRLDAVGVAREQQAVRPRVPQREGEHAAQAAHHRGTVTAIQVQQHLGVGMGAELDAGALELAAQLGVVVDLAVEADHQRAVRRVHRLGARRAEIEDGEAPVAEADPPVVADPHARTVGAALDHGVAHPQQFGAVHCVRSGGVGEDPVDAAHFSASPAGPRAPRAGSRGRSAGRVRGSCPRPTRSRP